MESDWSKRFEMIAVGLAGIGTLAVIVGLVWGVLRVNRWIALYVETRWGLGAVYRGFGVGLVVGLMLEAVVFIGLAMHVSNGSGDSDSDV